MTLIPMLAACLCASAFAAAEWTQVVKNAPWKARSDPQLVAMPDNALLLYLSESDDSVYLYTNGDEGDTSTNVAVVDVGSTVYDEIVDGTWHHLAATWDGRMRTMGHQTLSTWIIRLGNGGEFQKWFAEYMAKRRIHLGHSVSEK